MTASDAKVSVVIPAKDAEATIGRAIRSIAGQTVRPDEVIVVDNGSQDRTVQAAERHQSGLNIRVISCSTPGSGAARNAGILASCGDYITFLDADDVWYPEKLRSQLSLIGDRSTAFCGTYMHYLSTDGRVLGNNVRYKDEQTASHALRAGVAMPVPLSSVLVGRGLIEASGLFDESFRRSQDFEWLSRISARAELRIPSRIPLVGYVLQAGSSSDDAYIEQGLAADAVRAAISSQTPPNYQRDVIDRMSSIKTPRVYAAGKHYRRAGALISQRKFLQASWQMTASLVIDPIGTIAKLRWQSVGKGGPALPPEVKQLFNGHDGS